MAKRLTTLKSWEAFNDMLDPFEVKMQTLQTSTLPYNISNNNRGQIWVNLIHPDFASECNTFYNDVKSLKQLTIAISIITQLRNDASKTFRLHLAHLNSEEKVSKIVYLIGMFIVKRPEIGYSYGMTHIMGLLLSIFSQEREAFLVFCYIIEKLFPSDYFLSDNRQLGIHRELRVISKMAEKLRPKLIATLKAEVRSTNSRIRKVDLTAFVEFVKRTSEAWLRSLFVSYLTIEDTLKVWDFMFIFGFEFLQKFILTLFSKNETSIKNLIKQETKNLNLGISVDSLIIAGNLSRTRLLRKLEKLSIEDHLRKSVSKSTYTNLKRYEYLELAVSEEKSNVERLNRLRQTKAFIIDKDFSYEVCENIFPTIKNLSSQEKVSRGLFISIATKQLNWPNQLSSSFYITLDQKGSDILSINHIKIGLSLFSNTLVEQKLSLCFKAFTNNKSISIKEVVELLLVIEEVVDCRSSIIKKNTPSLIENLYNEKFNEEEFADMFLTNTMCEYLLNIIKSIESNEEINSSLIKYPSFVEGYYNDTHSPMRKSSIGSQISDSSYEHQIYEDEIFTHSKITRTFEEHIDVNPPVVDFEYIDSDCEDIEISNEFDGNRIYFKVHIGKGEIEQQSEIESNKSCIECNLETLNCKPSVNEEKNFIKAIEIPEHLKASKERAGCSRLCSTQNCRLF